MPKNCKIQILLVNIFYSCLDLFSPHTHQQRKHIGGHLLRSRQSSRAQPREHKPVERPLMAELLVAKEWCFNLASQRSKWCIWPAFLAKELCFNLGYGHHFWPQFGVTMTGKMVFQNGKWADPVGFSHKTFWVSQCDRYRFPENGSHKVLEL